MAHLLYLTRMVDGYLFKIMRFILNLLFPRSINLMKKFMLNLQVLNMQLVHIFKIPYLKGIIGVTLHILRIRMRRVHKLAF